jgi:hypothetical protein
MMRLGYAGFILGLISCVATPLFSQTAEIPDTLDQFLDGALQLHISARIVDEDASDTVWTMDVTRITVSGRAVNIRLDGTNISVIADFTPYWEDDDSLLLLVQGQTWIYDGADDPEPEYRTSFSTLPIRLGEPIVFLPLGTSHVPLDTERFGRLNIELEVNVERYQS